MKRPSAIDPHECRCTECLTGEYVPLDWATAEDVEDLAAGWIENHTGLTIAEIVELKGGSA